MQSSDDVQNFELLLGKVPRDSLAAKLIAARMKTSAPSAEDALNAVIAGRLQELRRKNASSGDSKA